MRCGFDRMKRQKPKMIFDILVGRAKLTRDSQLLSINANLYGFEINQKIDLYWGVSVAATIDKHLCHNVWPNELTKKLKTKYYFEIWSLLTFDPATMLLMQINCKFCE